MNKVKLALLTIISILFAAAALADVNYDFTGQWQGKGKLQEGEAVDAIDAQFHLDIKVSESVLSIQECWTVPDAIIGQKKSCYQNEFLINKYGQILFEGKQIGDIYPRYIMIFQGNSQVSEQMKFGIDTSGALIFHYTYANYDGGMVVRTSRLTRE